MADENHDDADEPVIPGPEGEVAAADAPVSVAPFIDDDEDDESSEAGADVDGAASDDDEVDGHPAEAPTSTRTSTSAVGAAVATSKTNSGKGGRKSSKPADADADAADADAETAGPKVTRRVVTSKRVTPKGGAGQKPSGPKKAKGQRSSDDDEGFRSARYTPPGGQGAYAQGPSPWWVPALLFGFLIVGALIIMLNYMGVFGDAQNLRLVIGLAFILAGILTSTQYR